MEEFRRADLDKMEPPFSDSEGTSDLKKAASGAILGARDELIELSHQIHAEAELAFEESQSSAHVAALLPSIGFFVQMGVADLKTALHASHGSGPFHIGVMAEYDALPLIGHACGHNIVSAASVGAALGLATVASELDVTVDLFGTPAEEGGGGKAIMLSAGLFESLHIAMMVHPAPIDAPRMNCLAFRGIKVVFRGKGAHASLSPESAINAGDAMTVSQVAIALLRQQMRRGTQVHGIVTAGGEAPNVIPDYSEGKWFVRSEVQEDLEDLSLRVERCFQAGGLATGCETEITDLAPRYTTFQHDEVLEDLYINNSLLIGRDLRTAASDVVSFTGSTDMANVSRVVPSIHPMIAVSSGGARNHEPAFADAAVSRSGDQAVIDGALALAFTGIDSAHLPKVRSRLMNK